MPRLTVPDGDPLHEVNHCHGPGRGHPCTGASDAVLLKGLEKVTGPDGSTWWIPEGSPRKAWYQQHADTTAGMRRRSNEERYAEYTKHPIQPDLSVRVYRGGKKKLRKSTRPHVAYEFD